MVGRNSAMQADARDDGERYDNVAISLHWLTAILVVAQFMLGQTWGWFARPTHHLMVVAHMSFGIILVAVVIARLLWRFVHGHDVRSLESGAMRIVSTTVHFALYALLLLEGVLGFLSRWEENKAMSFFGLQIASPYAGSGAKLAHQFQDIHNWIGWSIIVLAAGHASVALYHHAVVRDRVLARMLPGG